MQAFMVQVQLGSMFEDLSVKARNAEEAKAKARKLVQKNEALKVFRHRFANFVA